MSKVKEADNEKSHRTEPEGDETPLSLTGPDAGHIYRNLALVAMGEAKVKDLGPGYFVAEDGTVGIDVDAGVIEALGL
jgi:hypothetical protein